MSLTFLDNAVDLPCLAPRAADSHKGDYGRALLIGGSPGMAGAIALAGKATLRSGAGLATLAVPKSIQGTVASFEPSYMTLGLLDNHEGSLDFTLGATEFENDSLFSKMTALAIGPGLGQSAENGNLIHVLYQNLPQPLVLDADALNCLCAEPDALAHHAGERILTPHPGEFQRLADQFRPQNPVSDATMRDRDALCQLAVEIARRGEVVLVLKGHRTLITDGREAFLNSTGNPGMATGGSGDVLTGVITGLLCQGLSPLDATRLAVHVHGRAGDLAAAELGQVSLIASDLIDYLAPGFFWSRVVCIARKHYLPVRL